MPTERTEFQFSQRGGQNVLRTLQQIERSARGAATAWRQMNTASTGRSGGQNIAQQTRAQLTAIQQKNQALRSQTAIQRNVVAQERLVTQAVRQTAAAARRAGAVMQTAFRGAARAARSFLSTLSAIPRALGRVVSSPLGFLAGGAGVGLGVGALISASDRWLSLQNRIAATAGEAANNTALLAQIQSELFEIAQRSRSPLQELGELYGRLAIGARDAAVSQRELLNITETVAKSTVIGGGDPASVRGALIQFSQIVGAGGAARGIGQELRSIREQAPFLFVTIAEGLGRLGVTARGTTTELEKLAEQGQLTSDQVMQAVLEMSDEVERRFLRIQPTIGQAFTVLGNSLTRFIGQLSGATGAGEAFADMVISLADKIEDLGRKLRPVAMALRAAFGGEGADQPFRSGVLGGSSVAGLRTDAEGVQLSMAENATTIGERLRQQFDLLRRVFMGTVRGMIRGLGITVVEAVVEGLRSAADAFVALGELIGAKVVQGIAGILARAEFLPENWRVGLLGVGVLASGEARAARQRLENVSMSDAFQNFSQQSEGLKQIRANWIALRQTIGETSAVVSMAGAQLSGALGEGTESLNEKIKATESSFNKLRESFRAGIASAVDDFNNLGDVVAETGKTIGEALTSGIADALVDVASRAQSAEEAFRKLAASVLTDLARMILQFSILRALQASPLSFLFPGPASFTVPQLASGGVLDHGRLMGFAGGGAFNRGYVVDRPTIFPMANGMGLMGEAGPEAVVPLERGRDGRLGVNANGAEGGGVVVAPVLVTDSGGLDRMLSSKEADETLARLVRGGGAFAAAVKGAR